MKEQLVGIVAEINRQLLSKGQLVDIEGRLHVGRFGAARPVDSLTPTELRTWLVELRATLSPMSVAGYVRGLRALGNWLARDGLAVARALPRRVIEPLNRGQRALQPAHLPPASWATRAWTW